MKSKHRYKNIPLWAGLLLAHILLWGVFALPSHLFWYCFPPAIAVLGVTAFLGTHMKQKSRLTVIAAFGLITAVIFYLAVYLASIIINRFLPDLNVEITSLYETIMPVHWWHHLFLVLLIIPVEELFWRGYVQENLPLSPPLKVAVATLLYASAHITSGSFLLVTAAIAGGLLWGCLYLRFQDIRLCILSHLLFNILLLYLFPLA
ncbi:CPBP family intramembrane glutamic endopeptidase [Thalassobacillus sp. C254]|uniref:CPBP family intramembrane glutamic endopeptidase n=1 Tax=Thalassobacillus sp. C254 TaxID=1225341 RepID=UPI0006CF7235|nr:CPBP family intramembrane glutamic endopeptidase [Thalassobacillus sp. C254]